MRITWGQWLRTPGIEKNKCSSHWGKSLIKVYKIISNDFWVVVCTTNFLLKNTSAVTIDSTMYAKPKWFQLVVTIYMPNVVRSFTTVFSPS